MKNSIKRKNQLVAQVSKYEIEILNRIITKQNIKVRGAFNKFPDFFGMDTFINRTHKKL